MAPKRTASPLKNVPAGSKGAKESNRNKTPPKDSSRKKKVVKKKKPSKDDGLAKIEEVGVEVDATASTSDAPAASAEAAAPTTSDCLLYTSPSPRD